MKYIYTPDDAQRIANAVAKFLKRHKYSVYSERPLNNDAPYRTTLLAKRERLSILVEAQRRAAFDTSLQELAVYLLTNGISAELFIATDMDAPLTGTFLRRINQIGIGLMLVDDTSNTIIEREPNNPALKVSLEPTLKFGKHKLSVLSCLAKFNQPNSFLTANNSRKDALRDLCELVESLTEEVALAAAKKGYLDRSEDVIRAMKWSDQINVLGAAGAYAGGHPPFVSEALKTDLHSFRNGRNLVDHKVRSKREEALRQQKFPDRMMTGVRLVADLAYIKSKITRKKRLTS